jgi:hypothetical protein
VELVWVNRAGNPDARVALIFPSRARASGAGALGVFKAGRIHAQTSILDVLKRIVGQDAATTGDRVILPDRILLILPQSAGRV